MRTALMCSLRSRSTSRSARSCSARISRIIISAVEPKWRYSPPRESPAASQTSFMDTAV